MKKYVHVMVCLVMSSSPLKAVYNVQDSLYLFCEQIGEDSTTISQIKNSPDAKNVRNFCSRMMNLSKYLVRMPLPDAMGR